MDTPSRGGSRDEQTYFEKLFAAVADSRVGSRGLQTYQEKPFAAVAARFGGSRGEQTCQEKPFAAAAASSSPRRSVRCEGGRASVGLLCSCGVLGGVLRSGGGSPS